MLRRLRMVAYILEEDNIYCTVLAACHTQTDYQCRGFHAFSLKLAARPNSPFQKSHEF